MSFYNLEMCQQNGNVWTSVTAGGNWNDASNWDDATLGAPNGKGELATFNPATKAGVAVTLDEPVTLGGLVFTDAMTRSPSPCTWTADFPGAT